MKWLVAVTAAVLLPVSLLLLTVLTVERAQTSCTPVPAAGTAGTGGGGKMRPMAAGTYTATSGYGPRAGGFHYGVDWAAAPGTPIYAAASGVVAEAGPASGFGMWVVLDHNGADGLYSTVYGHMFADDILVATGDAVTVGQQIARVGYNGETVPEGPGGAHLHWEVWPGGRLAGGSAIDPDTWLADATEPGAGSLPVDVLATTDVTAPGPGIGETATTPAPDREQVVPAAAVEQLAALPPEKGSEEGLQVDAVRVVRDLAARFPQITSFGTWRPAEPGSSLTDHSEGRAVDVMISDYLTGEGKALGDNITDYVMSRAGELAVTYTIWRGVYRDATGAVQQMPDHGDDTANHYDHVHISVVGGGPYDGGPVSPGAVGQTPRAPGCEAVTSSETGGGSDDLAEGAVPEEYAQWYRQAGSLCPQISASLLAAQGKQESGFDPTAESSAGAQGIAQFLPGTAASINPDDGRPYVIDADGNGTASVWEPADAIIGQGRYMCALAHRIDGWIADGSVTTHNPRELYLAAYNAGEGAVLRSGGFPTGHPDYQLQTRPYVEAILAQAPRYSSILS